ncbi:unnamed protein product [[Candida] boidinii]|uniref:Unnamed protein product n=1 Tax=Candida boidinii TaxID=5477 RepID=A0A9W6STE8_CANBO|nr:unnamed protein product [[Candida] boidinii]GMF51671.1 unnamed protein product [[Candida] boidinii]GMF98357.1 unnamed protein product [[Candida] boidinii]
MDITLGQGFPVPGDSGPGGLGAEWAKTLREGEDCAGEQHTTMWPAEAAPHRSGASNVVYMSTYLPPCLLACDSSWNSSWGEK